MSARGGCVSVTQSDQMLLVGSLVLWLAVSLTLPGVAQEATADYTIDGPHPRLLLTPRRKKLLTRERERQAMRWLQLEAHAKREGALAEPGFAHALRYIASGEKAVGRKAIAWALANQKDVRQQALVLDWCHDLLTESERKQLAARLRRSGGKLREATSISEVRDRLMAAVAAADEDEELAAGELHWLVNEWWRQGILKRLKRGEYALPRSEIYPFVEILHVVRDNLRIDLRYDYRRYFAELPIYLLLSYYPAVYPAPENEFHVPVIRDGSEPDPRKAALARAADLSLVAYDANSVETQFLQGWSMQDSFLMRGVFGIAYEFLWANPYHPGLSYYSAPRLLYDGTAGRLLARSSWDGDAQWLYNEEGVMQTFSDRGIQPLTWETFTEPADFGGAVALPLHDKRRFSIDTGEATQYFLLGLEPNRLYDIEVDDEGLFEARADRGGMVALEFPAGRKAGVRFRESMAD